jgi:hypothetical protein
MSDYKSSILTLLSPKQYLKNLYYRGRSYSCKWYDADITMIEYKNQHYVPQFYLTRFSPEGTGIYRYVKSKRITERKSLEKVCSSFHFYAGPSTSKQAEGLLSDIEKMQGVILKKVIDEKDVGTLNPSEYYSLLSFILLSSRRTKAAKMEHEALANAMFDKLKPGLLKSIGEDKISEKNLDNMKMRLNGADTIGMLLALNCPEIISDLSTIILVNKTKIPFYTSDSPVVYYNYIKVRNRRPTGLQNPGLLIIFPVSEQLSLCLFDPSIYLIGLKGQNNIEIIRDKDIEELNKLQLLNCNEYVLFSNESQHDHLKNIQDKLGNRKKNEPSSSIIERFSKGDEYHEIIKLTPSEIDCPLNISFIRLNRFNIRNAKKTYEKASENGRTVVTRSPEISKLCDRKMRDIEKNQKKWKETDKLHQGGSPIDIGKVV